MAGSTHHVKIDRSMQLAEEPGTRHNRRHEDIPPLITVDPGDHLVDVPDLIVTATLPFDIFG